MLYFIAKLLNWGIFGASERLFKEPDVLGIFYEFLKRVYDNICASTIASAIRFYLASIYASCRYNSNNDK
jgi:hypothetical protein